MAFQTEVRSAKDASSSSFLVPVPVNDIKVSVVEQHPDSFPPISKHATPNKTQEQTSSENISEAYDASNCSLQIFDFHRPPCTAEWVIQASTIFGNKT